MSDKYDYLRRSYVTPEEAAAHQIAADQEALAQEGAINLGLRRGLNTTPAMLASGAGQLIEPFSPELSQPLFDYAQRGYEAAQRVPTKVASWEEVDGLRKGLQFIGEKTGEQLPNLAFTAATLPFTPERLALGGAAAARGLGGGKALQSFGSTLARSLPSSAALMTGEGAEALRSDPEIMASSTPAQRALASLGYGIAAAPLEAADDALLLARGAGAGGAVKNIFQDGFKQGMKAAVKRVAGAVPESALVEGVPEAVQQTMQQGMQTAFNPNRDKSKDTKEALDSFFGGWAGGGGMSVAGRGADVAWSNARGLQQKVGEFLANKFPKNADKLSDQEILQHDGDNLARAFEAAQEMSQDPSISDQLRNKAAEYLDRAQQGVADWMDFAPIAEARKKFGESKDSVNRVIDTAKEAYKDVFGKEGKNAEFTQDDQIIFDTLRQSFDPNSTLAQDNGVAGDLYNVIKHSISSNDYSLPLHALGDDFGGVDNLHKALDTMRSQMVRAGMVDPDESFSDALKSSLTTGRTRDTSLSKLVKSNLKLEYGELSDKEASTLAQRIERGFQNYGSMKKEQRTEFDKQLDQAFGKNAGRIAEALGVKHVQEKHSIDESDDEGQQAPEFQTIFETEGAQRRFLGSATERAAKSEDGSDHGGMWRLDHGDMATRKEVRSRMAQEIQKQRGLGNIVKSLTPAEYAEAAGVNKEELAKQLNTTVENLGSHPARMLMVEAKTLDRDSVDLNSQDIARVASKTKRDLSTKVDAETAAKVAAALKLPPSEGRRALRELGQEHAVSVEGNFVKSNLAHGGAGRFTVTMKDGSKHVMSAQELIKEMRQRHDSTNPKVDNRPNGDADLLRHFATGISSLLNNPDVAGIEVNDIWGRPASKDKVRGEASVKNQKGGFDKAQSMQTQNAYAGLVGRFGGFFKLNDKVNLNTAIRAQERGGQGVDYEALADSLDNYPSNLLKGHLSSIQKNIDKITKSLQNKDAKKPKNVGKLGRYRAIIEVGQEILDERERQDGISAEQLLRERLELDTPEDQAATTFEMGDKREKARVFQEETGEPLHPHGEAVTKDKTTTQGSLSQQRMPMKLARGVAKEHFTPMMRSIVKDVENLYGTSGFKGALDTVLNHIAEAAEAVMHGDKALMKEIVDKTKSNLAVVTDGMMKRLATQGKAETDAAKKDALRAQYAEAKRLHEKYKAFMPKEEIGADETVQQNKEAKSDTPISDAEMKEIEDYIEKVLGPDVATQFVKTLINPKTGKFESGSAQWIRKNGKAIIQIVARAANPMSKAHHEAMHEFFQRLMDTSPEAAEILSKAASSALVVRQIEQFFHDNPNRTEIIQQIKNSEHERVAYMFQLWAAGQLNVGPKTENVFQKVVNFLRKALGMLNADQKAEVIMQAFHDGKMSEPSAVAEQLSKLDALRNEKLKEMAEYARAAGKAFMHFAGTTSGNLIGNENPHLDTIGRLLYNETGSTEEQAFLSARDQKTNQMLNRVASIFEGVDKKDIDLTLDYLQKGKVPADPKLKALHDRTRTMLDQIFEYLEKSDTGVQKRKNYFPRVWDVENLSTNKDQFLADLEQYHMKELQELADQHNEENEKKAEMAEKAGNAKLTQELRNMKITPQQVAEGVFHTLMNDRGADPILENEFRVGYTPFMQAANRRSLGWINDEVFAKYYNKDMVHILTTYAAQAAHKGEYTKRFGRDGYKLRQGLEKARMFEAEKIAVKETGDKDILNKIRKQLAKDLEMKVEDVPEDLVYGALKDRTGKDIQAMAEHELKWAKRDIMAQEGTLGHDISERLRKFSSAAIVYENVRLLPYSLFAQFTDPLGVMINGGNLNQAFDVFKSGIVGVIKGWQGTSATDEKLKLARTLGIIDAHATLNSMGSLYSSLYMGKVAKKWNDRLFRINGVEAFTQWSRAAALEVGIDVIENYLKNGDKRHLSEYHLDPKNSDLYMKDGKLNPFHPDVQAALMRFVDQSIIRPNAAIRPAHGSDPRISVLFHMKGFTYAFHKVILEKIAHEAKNGNYDPAFTAALAYIPVAIAAATVRGLLANGGDEPDWKKRWKAKDYFYDGVQRAGLLGIPQLGLDVAKWGPVEMLGPAVEQGVDAVKAVNKQVGQHMRLKDTDKERYEKDNPLVDAGHKIFRDALPHTFTRDWITDKHYRDSSRT